MKKIVLFLFISCSLYSQSKQEAVEYINQFFNETTNFQKSVGGFKFLTFDNTLKFYQETIIFNPSTFETHYVFITQFETKVENIKSYIFEKKEMKGTSIIYFKLYFNSAIPYFYSSKNKGGLPEKSTDYRDDIPLIITTDMSDEQVINFKRAMDILSK